VSGVGAARRCTLYDGGSIVETVTVFEPNSRVRLVGSEFSMPLHTLELEFTFEQDGSNKTKASCTIEYVVKFGLIGRLLGELMMKPMMTAAADKVLAGTAHYLATNETVGPKTVLQTSGRKSSPMTVAALVGIAAASYYWVSHK